MSNWPWVGVLVLFLAVTALAVTRWRRVAPSPQSGPRDETDALMAALADQAVSRASAEFHRALDFSPESVRAVEQILGKLYQPGTRGEMPEERLHREAKMWGAYIGEVIRRKQGGHWERDSVFGQDSYPLHHGGGQSFPVAWCGKRLINGDEDNVWFKYQVMTAPRAERGLPN